MSGKLSIWMPLYWGDYWKDTQGLTCAQHGAYLNLIGECWMRKGLLPADDDELWRFARADGPKHWQEIKGKVLKLFRLDADGYRHKRVEFELQRQAKVQRVRSEKGRQGAEKRWRGRADGKSLPETEAQPVPQASGEIVGALPERLPAECQADGKYQNLITPLTPQTGSAESGSRPPLRLNAQGGLRPPQMPRVPATRPLSPSEFRQRQERLAAESAAAGLLPSAEKS